MTLLKKNKVTYRFLGGIFFISLAALIFEVSLSRLLAITLWSHFAFLIISCALLGYGTAGSWLLVFRRLSEPFYPALFFAVSLVPLFLTANRLPFDPALLPLDSMQWVYLTLLFILLALPFFFSGLALNLTLRKYPLESFSLYCFDLLGAAAGCFVFFLIAPFWNEANWLIIISLVSIISAWFFVSKRLQIALVCLVSAGMISLILFQEIPPLKISPYKALPQALQYPGSKILKTEWNAVSRVDWFESPLARFAPGLSLNYRGSLPYQVGITIDGDQLTAYSSWQEEELDYLNYLPGTIIYKLLPSPNNILFLQVLGGQDVQAAISFMVPSIQLQTENSILARWLEDHNPYSNIKIETENVRTFLARTSEKYDRIMISLEGALPTGGSGLNVLQKSSLETVEGMTELLEHLSNDGWLAIHRYLLPPPRAELRLIATLNAAMEKLGWNPSQHLGVFRTVSTIMVLVSKTKWTENDKAFFRKFCTEQQYAIVYYPDMRPEEANQANRFSRPIYAQAVQRLLNEKEKFFEESVFDLKPVTDERPFFYNFLRFDRLKEIYIIFGRKWEALIETGLLLPGIFIMVLLIALICIGTPILLRKNTPSVFTAEITFFFWIGLGFMSMEIVLLEKLTLFLGEPSYSLALVLSGLLVFSGIGSAISRHFSLKQQKKAHVSLLILLVIYGFGFAKILTVFYGSLFPVRLTVALLLIGPPGLLMGVPFPSALVKISRSNSVPADHNQNMHVAKDRVAMAWCLNGFASVIGSVGAMLLAQLTGLSSLFLWSCLFYFLALAIFRPLSIK